MCYSVFNSLKFAIRAIFWLMHSKLAVCSVVGAYSNYLLAFIYHQVLDLDPTKHKILQSIAILTWCDFLSFCLYLIGSCHNQSSSICCAATCTLLSYRSLSSIFTARRSYSAVLRVIILSVRLSVCLLHACFVTKPNNALWIYFDTTRKGNHSSFLAPTVIGGWCPFRLKFALKMIHPFEKRRLRQISVKESENVQLSNKLMMECVSPPKGGSRSDVLFKKIKPNFHGIKSAVRSFFVWKLRATKL